MDIRNTKDIETLRKKKYDVLINNAGLGRGFDKIYKKQTERYFYYYRYKCSYFPSITKMYNPKHGKREKRSYC